MIRVLMTALAGGAAGLGRSLLVVAACAATVVAAPVTASASAPDRGTFSSHDVYVDSDVCSPEGFSVNVVQDESGAFRVLFDRNGDVSFVEVHMNYTAVITANGHTIVEKDRWMDTYYPDGTARTVGDTVHIQGLGPGLVQHDAGKIAFAADGSVAAIRGPHPQLEGQTFCFALLP